MVKKTVEPVVSLPKAAIARIAKNNGAERIGSAAVNALVTATVDYASVVSKKANTLANHAGRKTITEDDITLAVQSL